MFAIDGHILVIGVLILLATLSSKVSARIGVPLLVVFVVIGMLAGSEGPGGIAFTDYSIAHAVGTVALILILFDGGLQTSMAALRRTAAPAGTLASVGVLITAAITGVLASYALDIPLAYGLLVGSIVGSTDAAAVFATLRNTGLHLRPRLTSTLEVESGSNDPMAVLLTIGCLEFIRGNIDDATSLIVFFVRQIGVGVAIGWSAGRGLVWLMNRIRLSAAGLYPILSLAGALVAFGVTAALGGSGILSVYIAGIVIGNNRVVFQRGVRLFHDGLAWLGQITMFVVLGLLSFPSHVREAESEGILLAGVLMLIARPAAVAACLLPFRYDWREIVFASWAGLKGAVPIILAIYPLMFAIDHAESIFNLVFFVVLVSVVIQGWSLGPLARWLDLTVDAPPVPPVTIEVTSLQDVDADIVSYLVKPNARAAHRRLDQLNLDVDMVVALIVRDRALVVPKGSTEILPGDHVFVTLRPKSRWLVDHVFSPEGAALLVETLDGRTTLAELEARYGLPLPGAPTSTLADILRERLGRPARKGDTVTFGMLRFTVFDSDRNGQPLDVQLDLAALVDPSSKSS
ncbi:MAG TPA: potassium/proton antiporter [Enhygromyxa sp.]|nr:potassium/proton antiporter [Enhygromyxa sp.]